MQSFSLFQRIGIVVLLAAVLSSCSFVFPANNRSHDLASENVTLKVFTWKGLVDRLNTEDLKAAKVDKETVRNAMNAARPPEEFLPILAGLAAPLVGLGIDYVKQQLQQESELYTAQFGTTVPEVGFWAVEKDEKAGVQANANYFDVKVSDQAVNNNKVVLQQIIAFELIRTTKGNTPAFDLLCLLVPSQENGVFLVQPIYLVDNSAKAKILGEQPWAPWTYLPWVHTGNTVQIQVEVTLDAIWIDKDQTAQTTRVAAFKMPQQTVTLGVPVVSGFEKGGWFPGVPRTEQISSEGVPAPGANGAFWLGLTVTEKDPSNAKQFIEQAAKAVGDNKQQIQNTIVNYIPKK